MTEAEWLEWDDPQPMLVFLRGKISDRKLRLLACACCRRIWHFFDTSPSDRKAIEVAEQFADNQIGPEEVRSRDFTKSILNRNAWEAASWASGMACTWDCEDVGGPARDLWPHVGKEAADAEKSAQVLLLHDIFANPFRLGILDDAWRMSIVDALARAAYQERLLPSGEIEPCRLAILSDALEDVGCTDAAILDHLRSPGPHVRGCWALDQLLSKT